MKDKTVTFIGHNECFNLDEERLYAQIEQLILKGYTHFLSGGMGSFDWICAHFVYLLKERYPHIENILVIPYLTFKIRETKYFDSIIYPEGFETYHFKAAIPKRNQYLVDHSSVAICYVDHDWGGAAKTYERAKKEGIQIINLGQLNVL